MKNYDYLYCELTIGPNLNLNLKAYGIKEIVLWIIYHKNKWYKNYKFIESWEIRIEWRQKPKSTIDGYFITAERKIGK